MHRFFAKPNREIVDVTHMVDQSHLKAHLERLKREYGTNIPKVYLDNWAEVALYNPKGNLDEANALLIDPNLGAYDLGNKLNDLTGKEWTKFTCSWFIFNALPADLKKEKSLDLGIEEHPATFSPTMITEFIKFFTKEGMTVFDPFLGIGSTIEAAVRTNRIGFGTELNPKYYNVCIKRFPSLTKNIFNINAELISEIKLPQIDFSISSPPYWDVLNRSTKDFHTSQTEKGFDLKYSEANDDLGNIEDYDLFINKLASIYIETSKKMRKASYLVIITKNVKKKGKLFPIAWDLSRQLSDYLELKDEKIWIQDKVGLAPYGYPYAWAANILHHYCLIFQVK